MSGFCEKLSNLFNVDNQDNGIQWKTIEKLLKNDGLVSHK